MPAKPGNQKRLRDERGLFTFASVSWLPGFRRRRTGFARLCYSRSTLQHAPFNFINVDITMTVSRILGTPLSPSATRVMLLGAGELGKEVIIALQRLGVEVIAVDRYAERARPPGGAPRARDRHDRRRGRCAR